VNVRLGNNGGVERGGKAPWQVVQQEDAPEGQVREVDRQHLEEKKDPAVTISPPERRAASVPVREEPRPGGLASH